MRESRSHLRSRVLLLALVLVASVACEPEETEGDGTPTATPSPTPIPTPIGQAPEPPVGDPIPGLTPGAGWTDPRDLGSVINTVGWEDSSFMSADGQTFYFGYSRGDVTALMNGTPPQTTGPTRPGHDGEGFDIYEARIESGAWVVSNSSVNQSGDMQEAAIGVDRYQTRMVFVRWEPNGNIRLAERVGNGWGPSVALDALNSPCEDDNPTLSADGDTIWFDSNRTATGCGSGQSARRIYESHFSNGTWSAPVQVTGVPNTTDPWQAFVTDDGSEMYWSAYGGTIVKAPREGSGWGAYEIVLQAQPWGTLGGEAIAVGESSVTADGRFLYFTYVTKPTVDHFEVNLGVMRRL